MTASEKGGASVPDGSGCHVVLVPDDPEGSGVFRCRVDAAGRLELPSALRAQKLVVPGQVLRVRSAGDGSMEVSSPRVALRALRELAAPLGGPASAGRGAVTRLDSGAEEDVEGGR
ncbi:MAG: hypothetical protein NW201_06155 [Gemmatimonadales bacterium]|nr:hypothetical protein [Gemmatimonadales bacterium]